jgi:hypothetical protein
MMGSIYAELSCLKNSFQGIRVRLKVLTDWCTLKKKRSIAVVFVMGNAALCGCDIEMLIHRGTWSYRSQADSLRRFPETF